MFKIDAKLNGRYNVEKHHYMVSMQKGDTPHPHQNNARAPPLVVCVSPPPPHRPLTHEPTNPHQPNRQRNHICRAAFVPLLSTYIPFNISQFENIAVTPGGKRMYLVQNGSVHLFPNFDTMTALNISMKNVIYMGNWTEFSSIPEVRTPIYAPIYDCK